MARTKARAKAKQKVKVKQKVKQQKEEREGEKVIAYAKMVKEAIVSLKDPRGSSLAAIKKYIAAKWQVPAKAIFAGHLRRCLARELGKGTLLKCKQTYKLASVKEAPRRKLKQKPSNKPQYKLTSAKKDYKMVHKVAFKQRRRAKPKLQPQLLVKCGVCRGPISVSAIATGGVLACPTCGWRSDAIPIEVILCTGERHKAVLREATHPGARGFPRGCIFIFKGHHEAHLGDDKFHFSDVVGSTDTTFVRVEGEGRVYRHRCFECSYAMWRAAL